MNLLVYSRKWSDDESPAQTLERGETSTLSDRHVEVVFSNRPTLVLTPYKRLEKQWLTDWLTAELPYHCQICNNILSNTERFPELTWKLCFMCTSHCVVGKWERSSRPTWLLCHIHFCYVDPHVLSPVRKLLPRWLELLARWTPGCVADGDQVSKLKMQIRSTIITFTVQITTNLRAIMSLLFSKVNPMQLM